MIPAGRRPHLHLTPEKVPTKLRQWSLAADAYIAFGPIDLTGFDLPRCDQLTFREVRGSTVIGAEPRWWRDWRRGRDRRALRAHGSDDFFALADAMSLGVIVLDARRAPVRMNAIARGLLTHMGFPDDLRERVDLAALRLSEADRATPPDEYAERVDKLIAMGGAVPMTMWVGDEHDRRTVWVVAREISGRRGPRGSVIFARDVTTKYDATRVRDEFLRDAAHRLRGQLTAVSGYAELLSEDVATQDAAQRILRSTNLLVDTVDDLLHTAREEIIRSIDATDLSAALTDVCSVFLPIAAARGMSLHLRDEGCGLVRFDQAELRQVLAALVSNAIDHCAPGGRITIEAHRTYNHTSIVVIDDGVTTDEVRHRELEALASSSTTEASPRCNSVRANQATLTVQADHPHGTVSTLVVIAA